MRNLKQGERASFTAYELGKIAKGIEDTEQKIRDIIERLENIEHCFYYDEKRKKALSGFKDTLSNALNYLDTVYYG